MHVVVIKGQGPICSPLCGTKTHRDGSFDLPDAIAKALIECGACMAADPPASSTTEAPIAADAEITTARRPRSRAGRRMDE